MSEKYQMGCWVRLAGLSGAAAWRWLAEAEAITLAGWEHLALYVHHDVEKPRLWAVTEASSGLCVTQKWRTRQEAIEDAERRLSRAGATRAAHVLASEVEAHGPPPPRPLGAEEEGARREAP